MRRIGPVALCLVVPLAATGCDRLLGLDHISGDGDGGVRGDVGTVDTVDAPVDTPPGTVSFGSLYFTVSYVPGSLVAKTYSTATTIHTGNDAECSYVRMGTGSQPSVCVLLFDSIEVSGNLIAIGDRPLALAAASDIIIDMSGSVDVSSSHNLAVHGAGGSFGGCASADGQPHAASQTRASGGAGGSFGETGGNGGAGDNGTAIAAPAAMATFVRGGCHGGKGGDGPAAAGGAAGEGGGAVYLIAGGSIRIDGEVLANGEGGNAGTAFASNFAGGGGGGSGGLIALDAKNQIKVGATGKVLANGGGGGGGADTIYPGLNGEDAHNTGLVARGGRGGAPQMAQDFAGDGGDGSSPSSSGHGVMGLPGSPTQGGGGGGGGGEGYVRFRGTYSSDTGAVVQPPPAP